MRRGARSCENLALAKPSAFVYFRGLLVRVSFHRGVVAGCVPVRIAGTRTTFQRGIFPRSGNVRQFVSGRRRSGAFCPIAKHAWSNHDATHMTAPARILLVEDDADQRELLSELLASLDVEVVTARDFESASQLLQQDTVDMVLTDLQLGRGQSGLDVCDCALRISPGLPVIVVTGHGSMDAAINAIRRGAYDFLTKPIDAQLLRVSVLRALEHQRVLSELKRLKQAESSKRPDQLLGQCEPMLRVYDLIQRVAESPASVLLSGESGTGKEVVAKALHQGSGRSGPFVAINCGAVPANLLEAELFGHEKGAFTGAARSRRGLLVEADKGTLLLDEVGEMPEEMQVKLLRVLQERKVRPLGGVAEVSFDVRVIAASHRDLESEIDAGRFREDLYYRLNVVQIHLPPLRLRGNDILLLANSFVQEASRRLGREVAGISAEAAKLLLNFDWPGNIRQLQNCVERAVTLTQFNQLTPDDLPEKIRGYSSTTAPGAPDIDPEHVQPLDVVERLYIDRVLEIAGGNKSLAARLLGMDRRTLYRKLDGYQETDES